MAAVMASQDAQLILAGIVNDYQPHTLYRMGLAGIDVAPSVLASGIRECCTTSLCVGTSDDGSDVSRARYVMGLARGGHVKELRMILRLSRAGKVSLGPAETWHTSCYREGIKGGAVPFSFLESAFPVQPIPDSAMYTVMRAVASGSTTLVEAMLQSGRYTITPGMPVSFSVGKSNSEAMQRMAEELVGPPLRFHFVIQGALNGGHAAFVHELMRSRYLTPSGRLECMAHAVGSGKVELVRLVLELCQPQLEVMDEEARSSWWRTDFFLPLSGLTDTDMATRGLDLFTSTRNLLAVCLEMQGQWILAQSEPTTRCLHRAAQNGNVPLVQFLREHCGSFSWHVASMVTQACMGNRWNVLEVLGVPDKQDFMESDALEAATNGHVDLLCFILARRKPSTHFLNLLLTSAAQANRLDVVRTLGELGANAWSLVAAGHLTNTTEVMQYAARQDERVQVLGVPPPNRGARSRRRSGKRQKRKKWAHKRGKKNR